MLREEIKNNEKLIEKSKDENEIEYLTLLNKQLKHCYNNNVARDVLWDMIFHAISKGTNNISNFKSEYDDIIKFDRSWLVVNAFNDDETIVAYTIVKDNKFIDTKDIKIIYDSIKVVGTSRQIESIENQTRISIKLKDLLSDDIQELNERASRYADLLDDDNAMLIENIVEQLHF